MAEMQRRLLFCTSLEHRNYSKKSTLTKDAIINHDNNLTKFQIPNPDLRNWPVQQSIRQSWKIWFRLEFFIWKNRLTQYKGDSPFAPSKWSDIASGRPLQVVWHCKWVHSWFTSKDVSCATICKLATQGLKCPQQLTSQLVLGSPALHAHLA